MHSRMGIHHGTCRPATRSTLGRWRSPVADGRSRTYAMRALLRSSADRKTCSRTTRRARWLNRRTSERPDYLLSAGVLGDSDLLSLDFASPLPSLLPSPLDSKPSLGFDLPLLA